MYIYIHLHLCMLFLISSYLGFLAFTLALCHFKTHQPQWEVPFEGAHVMLDRKLILRSSRFCCARPSRREARAAAQGSVTVVSCWIWGCRGLSF